MLWRRVGTWLALQVAEGLWQALALAILSGGSIAKLFGALSGVPTLLLVGLTGPAIVATTIGLVKTRVFSDNIDLLDANGRRISSRQRHRWVFYAGSACSVALLVAVLLLKPQHVDPLSKDQRRALSSIARQFSSAMLDAAGCQVLAVGRELANTACPGGAPPGVCDIAELQAFVDLRIEDLNNERVSKIFAAGYKMFCGQDIEVKLDARCIKSDAHWYIQHSTDRISELLGTYSGPGGNLGAVAGFTRAALTGAVDEKAMKSAIGTLVAQLSERSQSRRADYYQAKEEWDRLARECQPNGCAIEFAHLNLKTTAASWEEFEEAVFRAGMVYFAEAGASEVPGAILGCDGAVMLRSRGGRWHYRWQLTENSTDPAGEEFRFQRPRHLDAAAKALSKYLVPDE